MKDKKKKILKIIQVVYDIISAMFIVFVCVALAITPTRDNSHSEVKENNTLEVERKSRDNYFTNNGYSIIGIQECITNNNFYYLLFLPQEHFESIDTIGTILTSTRINNGTRVVPWNSSGISHDDLGYSSGIDLSNVTFKLLSATTSNNVFLQSWEITFNYSNNSYNRLSVDIFYNSVSGISYGQSRLYSVIYSTGNSNITIDSALVTPSSTAFGEWINDNASGGSGYNAGYATGKSDGWTEGYNTGYTNGYDLGFAEGTDDGNSSGYDNGYQVGLDAGYDSGYDAGYIAASQGVESNAFTAIGSAISACAGLFNIQVLPNLTLGVLLLVPAIITIVIVVIKMIKG